MPRPDCRASAIAVVAALTLLVACPAWSQDKGGITGKVFDKRTSHAIPFATVTLIGAQKGGLTDSEGKFLITGVAPGTYELRVQFLGYAPAVQAGVVVAAGKSQTINVAMEEIVVQQVKAIEVTAERRLVEVRQGATVRSVNASEIRNLPVQTIGDVLQQQAGISVEADQIHVRGGRADETLFYVNGVANRDLVTGQSTAGQLNARSVAEVNVATGAYDVRYGNALSGVVEVKLKEGGDTFSGGITSTAGAYGGRGLQVTMGGPLKVSPMGRGTMNWFIDVSTDHTSTRFPSIDKLPGSPRLRSTYQDGFLGRNWGYNDSWAPSEDNNWAGRVSLAWKPSGTDRWNLDVSKRIGIDQGFSRTFINAAGDAGDPAYPWAWSRRIDHAPVIFEDNVQASLRWRRTLGTTGYTEAQFSRYYSALRREVLGKHWTQYEPPDDISLFPPGDPRRDDYFFDSGDDNTWQDRRTVSTAATWGLTHRMRRHEIELGFEHQAQTAQYVTIENPWEPDPDGLGGSHDIWKVHPWVGNLYLRDRLEFEGFTANVGMRADYWFVGREAERALANLADTINITPTSREEFFANTHSFFGRRYKLKLSPRIIVAHPIGTHSSFFFNYGQFTQNPSYRYVYSKLTSISSETFPLLGNVNLNPQTSINYEVGGKNEFRPGAAVNATFFVKDIYDYPTATSFTRTQGSNLVPILVYLNGHFARTKGFEVEFEKRRQQGYWSGKLSYTYQQTKGKSSDPNEAKVAQLNEFDAGETRLSETFVRWNRPHKVTTNFDLRFTDKAPDFAPWLKQSGFNVYVQGSSGRAFTSRFSPTSNQSAEPYSQNGPFQVTADVRVNRFFRLGSRRLDLSVAALNVFGTRIINRVDRVTGRERVWGVGEFDPDVFYPRGTNESEASYLRRLDKLRVENIDDPSNFGPPAQVRVTLDIDF
ncbi:MAG TPA: TonB-dependent receptor [Candidatus Eisenbacteria bacterium]|nr:TonB-dependent receptor [Candidatus Eisenbacteria bacterium]